MRVAAVPLLLLVCMAIGDYRASAQDMTNLRIRCGEKRQSYYSFCERLHDLVKEQCDADLQFDESQGSLENLLRPQPHDEYTWLMLVQQDTMAFAERESQKKEVYKRYLEHRFVASLYREKVHIVTLQERGIENLRGLNGKKIGIGLENSGTYVAALTILDGANVYIPEGNLKNYSVKEALTRLFSGELDAFFFVGGAPLTSIVDDLDRPQREKIRFVEIENYDKFVRPEYNKNKYEYDTFSVEEYDWLKKPVKTLRSTAILDTFDYSGEKCLNVAAIARLMYLNADKLQLPKQDSWSPNFFRHMPPWSRNQCVVGHMTQITDEVTHIAARHGDCTLPGLPVSQTDSGQAPTAKPQTRDCNCKKPPEPLRRKAGHGGPPDRRVGRRNGHI